MRHLLAVVLIAATMPSCNRGKKDASPEVADERVQKMLDALPAAPEGYVADKPRVHAVQFKDLSYSHIIVQCSYEREDDKRALLVKIHEPTGIAELPAHFSAAVKMKSEGGDGFRKGIVIDGYPGWEEFKSDTKHGKLSVLVNRRYIVHIETRGKPGDFARTVFKSIEVKKLAALK